MRMRAAVLAAAAAAAIMAGVPTGARAEEPVNTAATGIGLAGGTIYLAGGTGAGSDIKPLIAKYDAGTGALVGGWTYDYGVGSSAIGESYVDPQGITHAVVVGPAVDPYYTRIGADGEVVRGFERIELGVPNGDPFAINPVGSSLVVGLNAGGQGHFVWLGPNGERRASQTFQPGNQTFYGTGVIPEQNGLVVYGGSGRSVILKLAANETAATLTPDTTFGGGTGFRIADDILQITAAAKVPDPLAAGGAVYRVFGQTSGGTVIGRSLALTGTPVGDRRRSPASASPARPASTSAATSSWRAARPRRPRRRAGSRCRSPRPAVARSRSSA